ncbi:hypothetical protein [Bacteriovorax sp. DB6_IX]|uniref:hypothetical protein n=1 Tax=Bacteriovorax sp. DB6_IX TaxID=1353530 RepID=UPI000389DF10|nr:hypothetical protein [Bacteriovorax sp. DB6_IX]EQC50671.1 hypothetical protein M901_2003 [Bacteriovorax sp. DB6_IX]
MKNVILLIALVIGSNMAMAKAPADDSYSISQEQLENTEGKIQAGMILQKKIRIDDMKVQVQELLMRVSTIEKIQRETGEAHGTDVAIKDLLEAQRKINSLLAEDTNHSTLDEIQETLYHLGDEVEILSLDL